MPLPSTPPPPQRRDVLPVRSLAGPLALLQVLLISASGWSLAASAPRSARNHTGMVVSSSPIASQVGLETLKDGGNAVDAAVAAAFTLAVVYPRAGNLGGGGFLIYRDGTTGAGWTVDFRETAPGEATPTMYLGPDGEPVPGLSQEGYLAVAVPGSVAGLELAHQRYGLLSWKRVVRPAIRLARGGFIVSEALEREIGQEAAALARYPTSASIFMPRGRPLAAGTRLRQPDLARTLQRISDRGARGFYSGPTARAIVDDVRAHGGILSLGDLSAYRARVRKPLEGNYDTLKLLVPPPPSSGGVALLEILNMLEPFRLRRFGYGSAVSVHLMAEAERRAYADRATYLGDPSFFDVPTSALISKQYALTRGADISMTQATPSASLGPGNLLGTGSVAGIRRTASRGRDRTAGLPRAASPAASGASPRGGSVNTTHLAVVDRWKSTAAITTTLNSSFGAKVVAAGTGVLLNNEMDDFSIKPGAPNLYGLVGGEANEIRPGKRPLSSMCPTIVLKNNKPFLILGTPGGATIITSVAQVFLNVVEHGLSLETAVGAPRVHHQWLPDRITLEDDALPVSVQEQLLGLGHALFTREPKDPIGDFQAIRIDAARGLYEGVSDGRGPGEPRGY